MKANKSKYVKYGKTIFKFRPTNEERSDSEVSTLRKPFRSKFYFGRSLFKTNCSQVSSVEININDCFLKGKELVYKKCLIQLTRV